MHTVEFAKWPDRLRRRRALCVLCMSAAVFALGAFAPVQSQNLSACEEEARFLLLSNQSLESAIEALGGYVLLAELLEPEEQAGVPSAVMNRVIDAFTVQQRALTEFVNCANDNA